MSLYIFCLVVSLYSVLKFFYNKILVLLCLEVSLLCMICLYLFNSFSSKMFTSFFSSMIFLTFMVIDSVFGLSLLILSTRNSTIYNNFLFKI